MSCTLKINKRLRRSYTIWQRIPCLRSSISERLQSKGGCKKLLVKGCLWGLTLVLRAFSQVKEKALVTRLFEVVRTAFKMSKALRESCKTRKWIIPSDSECSVQAHPKIYNVNVYLYTAHITSWSSCLMAVYNSIEWDRTSACEGASGCRYQSIFDLTHPPTQPMHETRDRPQHRELHALPFSILITSPANTGDGAYGL